jgi:hypothetical protein
MFYGFISQSGPRSPPWASGHRCRVFPTEGGVAVGKNKHRGVQVESGGFKDSRSNGLAQLAVSVAPTRWDFKMNRFGRKFRPSRSPLFDVWRANYPVLRIDPFGRARLRFKRSI